jgi:hypothetical protein
MTKKSYYYQNVYIIFSSLNLFSLFQLDNLFDLDDISMVLFNFVYTLC